ncbi:MAG: sulfatase [Mariniblastus sp.]
MKKQTLIVSLFVFSWLLSFGQALNADGIEVGNSDDKTNRFNVLLIAVDDLRPELGCYGVEHAISPSIDALAKQSLVFDNHFVQVPTCGSSRYAMLTGRSPLFSNAMGNQALYAGKTALKRKPQPGAQSFPELFRRSGYHTTCIGKISHTADGLVYGHDGSGDGRVEMPLAWDDLKTPYGNWKRGWGIFFAYANGRSREDGDSKDVMEFVAEKDDDLPDGQMASAAIEQLSLLKESEKPFFLALGFFKPHLPLVATRGDWEAVKDIDVPLPPHNELSESKYTNRKSGEFFKYDFPFDKTRPLDDEKIRHNKRAYMACVRYTDRQIGRVMEALEKQGLSESTVVVLWSDHGWNLGDSQQWAKHTPLDRGVRSPLMIKVPGQTTGKHCVSLVETIDLYPTLMDICQTKFKKAESRLDGKSLWPKLFENPKAKVRDASFSYWRDWVSVRNDDFRLIGKRVDKKGRELTGIELYSREQNFDPIENLADQHPDVVASLLQEFRSLGSSQ